MAVTVGQLQGFSLGTLRTLHQDKLESRRGQGHATHTGGYNKKENKTSNY